MAFTLIRCKDAWSSNYRYIESDIAPLTGSATPYHLSSSYDIYSSGDYYQTAVFGAHDYIYIFALFDSEPIITQNTMGHNLDRGVFYDSNSGLWVLMAHAGFGLKEHWTDRSGGITCDCQFFDYINYDSLAQTRQAYLAYIQTVYVPPITYNWQSVPSISGKNGILSLVTLDSESINDGEPVSGAAVSVFDQNPVSGNNVKDIVDGNTPLIPSAVDVTAAFIISNPPVGELASRILAAKKGSIPESIEDADKTVSIPANASNVTMPGLDENSQYYFAIFVADAVGDTAVSDPKDIYTSADEGWSFDYTGSIQTFTAPKTGIYQLETWGAQGGDASDGTRTARGGYGAYAVGEVLLQQGDTLYINVGGQNGYGGGGGNYTMLLDNIPVSNAYIYNFGQAISGYTILDLSAEQKAESYYKTDAVIFTCQQYAEQITLSDKIYHHKLSSSAHIDQGVDGRTYYYLGGLKRIKNIKVKYRFTSRSSQYNYLAFGLANTIQNQRTYGFINITNPTTSQSYTEVSQAVDYVADYIEIATVAGVCDFKDLELSFEWA